MTHTTPDAASSGLPRRALVVLVVAAAIQLAVGALGPLDGDETLYWEWARHLAWGYFDHPPGVALLIRIGVSLFGVTAVGVRVMTVLANLAAGVMATVIARRHGGDSAATRTALILSCMPLLANWLMLATPDSALYLCAMAVLLLVDNALRAAPRSSESLRWWLAAGVALGCAALSKELAILLPIAIVCAATTHRELRPRLAEAAPYLAAVVTAIVIIPLVMWNRAHDWVLLRFALERGLGAEHGSPIGRELEYLGGQAALVSPLLFGMMALAVARTLRNPHNGRQHLLAVTSLVTFGWFAIAALRHPMEVNWVLMAYPPAAVLLATQSGSLVAGRWLKGGLAIGGAMVALLYLHTAVSVLPIAPLDDPIRRGHGWQEVAAHVDSARATPNDGNIWVAGNRFQDASQLAFYLDGHPFVYSINMKSRANQYDLWPGFAQGAKVGDRLLLVLDDSVEASIAHDLAPYFTAVVEGERVVAGGAHPTLVAKRIWLLNGWRGRWPKLQREGGRIFADPAAVAAPRPPGAILQAHGDSI